MKALRIVYFSLLAVILTGCAGSRAARIQDLNTQVAHLDGRVSMLEQQLGLIEGKAWNQREDVSYLKGRVEGLQYGSSSSGRAPTTKPTAKRIQIALKNAGYYMGNVDGKIGPQTKQAVREFQRTHGLSVDGKVGPKTWAQLAQYVTPE